MAKEFILGKDAKIYMAALVDPEAPPAIGALAEVDNVKDATLNMEAGEADITTRANGGWRATVSTLRECSCEFDMLWKPGDSGFDMVKAAFLAGSLLEMALLDQDRATSGAQGPKGAFSVTSFSRGEPLEEALTVSVAVKLAKYREWITV